MMFASASGKLVVTASISCVAWWLLVLLISTRCCHCDPAVDVSACRELGFSGSQSCSECDSLAQHVKDEGLLNECRHCCLEEKAESKELYTSARLETCPYRLSHLQEIKAFLENSAHKFPSLSIVQKVGARPRLILSGSDSQRSIRVDAWKSSTIEEYLTEKLAVQN